MRDISQKKFLKYIDSVEVYDNSDKREARDLDFCVINSRLSTGLITGEENMDEASFDDYGLWYSFADSKPWLCLHLERDGVEIGMSINPDIIQDWINLIKRYPEHAHYLPDGDMSCLPPYLVATEAMACEAPVIIGIALEPVVKEEPKTYKGSTSYGLIDIASIQDQKCPLYVNRKYATKTHSMCRTCPKMKGACMWNGWYNPFGDD